MPAYRFSWDPFDDRSVGAFAADIGFSGPQEGARDYLKAHVSRPDDEFVRVTRTSIARVWLPQYERAGAAIVRELFDRRIGPMGPMPSDANGCAEYVVRCRNARGLRELLAGRLVAFGDKDRSGDDGLDDGFVPRFGTVVPSKQVVPQIRPYPHQTDAWTAMDRHLDEAKATGVFKGVLVMPTGSGKTRTAAHWLLRRWLDEDTRRHVLWVAHRDELLRQAARTFYDLSGLAARRERLRIRLVSGAHCGFHQIDPADDLVLCSVASLARNLAKAKELLGDPHLFVVIDEAHHAPAKSYKDAIGVLSSSASHRLLGLTATPTRTAERERPELSRLFAGRVIYQVSAKELVAREILARPVPATVKTEVDAERGMTADDLRHLRDFHELSAEMRERLGRDEPRNVRIVKQYLDNREKYGKTLVFATDVRGAARLTDAFRQRLPIGVDAAYIASWRPDAKDGDTIQDREILDRFRAPQSGLDVLINVDMLTEGVDLPMTRTVFLARPTSSEILMRQMIGRALRGPAAGGNLEAHLVSFEDHWTDYRDVLSPMDVLADFEWADESLEAPTPVVATQPAAEAGALPPNSWDDILALSRLIRASVPDRDVDVFEAVPHGMFVLEYELEGEDVRHVVHVYEHQRSCWEALLAVLYARPAAELEIPTAETLDLDFFGDCEHPRPSRLDIETIVERARRGDPRPHYVPLEGRNACDPREIASLARGRDMRGTEINALLSERYGALARVIYPSAVEFRRAFDDAVRELEFPGQAPPLKGVVLFEPPASNPLRPGPHHDLPRLFKEMAIVGSQLLEQPVQHDGPLEWTGRIIKGWFAMAYFHGENAGRIRVNCLLNSPDISEETMRFLLWHEYLHLHLKQLHTQEFRRLERKWTNYHACDREMDGLNEKFGVQYW